MPTMGALRCWPPMEPWNTRVAVGEDPAVGGVGPVALGGGVGREHALDVVRGVVELAGGVTGTARRTGHGVEDRVGIAPGGAVAGYGRTDVAPRPGGRRVDEGNGIARRTVVIRADSVALLHREARHRCQAGIGRGARRSVGRQRARGRRSDTGRGHGVDERTGPSGRVRVRPDGRAAVERARHRRGGWSPGSTQLRRRPAAAPRWRSSRHPTGSRAGPASCPRCRRRSRRPRTRRRCRRRRATRSARCSRSAALPGRGASCADHVPFDACWRISASAWPLAFS